MAIDEKAKELAAIIAFRNRMYRDPKPGMPLPVSIAAFALLGSHFGYPTCCILHFCELAWEDTPPDPEAKQIGDRTLCPKCLANKKKAAHEV